MTAFGGARHWYVHVPFCARRCSYCDFAIAVRRMVPVARFVAAIDREIALRTDAAQDATRPALDSVYLGGGTPSLLGGSGIHALLDTIRRHATISPAAEVTVEANPDDVTEDAVDAWRAAGVTRVSLGVQSFDEAVLIWMHRTHTVEQIERAVRTLRERGIDNLSADMIFALPDSLGREWRRDLERVVALDTPHLSLYGLTVEPGTPLGRWQARGAVHEASDERYAHEFLAAHECLGAVGYEHYEVSNYGRSGHRARHNSAYWNDVPFAGFGPSAHGFDGASRRWNQREYAAWIDAVEHNADPIGGLEQLTVENRRNEAVYLGLRTSTGLPVSDGERESIARWEREGWVTITPDATSATYPHRATCTALGWLRLDALATALTDIRSRYYT